MHSAVHPALVHPMAEETERIRGVYRGRLRTRLGPRGPHGDTSGTPDAGTTQAGDTRAGGAGARAPDVGMHDDAATRALLRRLVPTEVEDRYAADGTYPHDGPINPSSSTCWQVPFRVIQPPSVVRLFYLPSLVVSPPAVHPSMSLPKFHVERLLP